MWTWQLNLGLPKRVSYKKFSKKIQKLSNCSLCCKCFLEFLLRNYVGTFYNTIFTNPIYSLFQRIKLNRSGSSSQIMDHHYSKNEGEQKREDNNFNRQNVCWTTTSTPGNSALLLNMLDSIKVSYYTVLQM